MKEIWKSITGYEGLYKVSNLGRVKSLNFRHTGKEKILRPLLCGGYLNVQLCKEGKMKPCLIHRLVATAFIENPENLPEVNHKNQVKTDNRVDNLEWCSRKYNVRYSKSKKVGQYKDGLLIKIYNATIDVEKDGFNQSNIVACCKGRYKSTGGYQWKYID